MFMLTLVSNLIPEYIRPSVMSYYFSLFSVLFFGSVLFLIVSYSWSQQSPLQPICRPARKDKHLIPRYVVPWLMSFLWIPFSRSCSSVPFLPYSWSQRFPFSLPARRDKHLIPRYVVPWAMSSSMVMPFLVIPSCFSAPTDKLEENKGFVLNLFWSG